MYYKIYIILFVLLTVLETFLPILEFYYIHSEPAYIFLWVTGPRINLENTRFEPWAQIFKEISPGLTKGGDHSPKYSELKAEFFEIVFHAYSGRTNSSGSYFHPHSWPWVAYSPESKWHRP